MFRGLAVDYSILLLSYSISSGALGSHADLLLSYSTTAASIAQHHYTNNNHTLHISVFKLNPKSTLNQP